MNSSNNSKAEKNSPQRKTAWIPIILCWLAYTSAYLGRYSYNSNITPIMESFGVNHAGVGLVATCFFFAYGVGQFVNGALCKYYNKRFIISFSLIVSSVLNLIVFLGVPFHYIKYLWLINGMIQSILWATLVLVMSENLKSDDLSKAIIVMSTSVATGTFLTYGASALFAVIGKYTYSFLLGAIVMTTVAVIWFLSYKKAFSGKYEEDVKEASAVNASSYEDTTSYQSLLLTVVLLGVFAIATNLVKDGLTTWVPAILKESYSLPDSLSIILTLFLPVLGCFAAMINSVAEKKIKSFINISCIWFIIASICIASVILLINTRYWFIVLLIFAVISLFMHGSNNVITNMAPLYMRGKVNSGFLAGILNGCCYIGSTMSSYLLGHIADSFGWNGVFIILLATCCLPVLITIIIHIFNHKSI